MSRKSLDQIWEETMGATTPRQSLDTIYSQTYPTSPPVSTPVSTQPSRLQQAGNFAGKVLEKPFYALGGRTLENIGQQAGRSLRGEYTTPQEQQQMGGQAIQDIVSLGLIGTGVGAGLGSAGRFAVAGGLTGAGEKLKTTYAPGEVAAGAGIGAAVGGAVGYMGHLLGRAFDTISKKVPERLMNHAVKPTLNELKKANKTKADTLGKELLDRKVGGSAEKMLTRSQQELVKNENQLQQILQNSTKTIKKEELGSYMQKLFAKKAFTPGVKKQAQAEIMKVYQEVPSRMTLPQANMIKRNLYNLLNDPAYKLDPRLSATKEAQKVVATGLRDLIEKKSATEGVGTMVKQLNKELAVFGRLQDRVIDLIARSSRNNILSLTNAILAGAAGVWGGVPGAIGVVGGRNILGSTTFQSTLANILQSTAAPTQAVSRALITPTVKAGTLGTIQKILQQK